MVYLIQSRVFTYSLLMRLSTSTAGLACGLHYVAFRRTGRQVNPFCTIHVGFNVKSSGQQPRVATRQIVDHDVLRRCRQRHQ